MSKLKTIKPLVGKLAPRFGYTPGNERERSQHRDDSQAWRRWYKTARWQKLRMSVLVRDLFTCQRTGVLLTGKHPAPNSPVVDHIKPHRGNEALFWDEKNLMAVSKAYHDKVKQAEEQSEIRGVWY